MIGVTKEVANNEVVTPDPEYCSGMAWYTFDDEIDKLN